MAETHRFNKVKILQNNMLFPFKIFITTILVLLFLGARLYAEDNMVMGIPFGGEDEVDVTDICPIGVQVFGIFMDAWKKQDFETMYGLFDDKSKEDFSFEEARFNFQFLKFKPYRISSVKKSGDDFDFFLSCGDWKDGDKEMRKLRLSGKTSKIIMASKISLFQETSF